MIVYSLHSAMETTSMSEPCGNSPRPRASGSKECRGYAQRLSRLMPGNVRPRISYVWDSEEAAKAFFTDELVERVTGLYGVRPSVEFSQIATLVENSRP